MRLLTDLACVYNQSLCRGIPSTADTPTGTGRHMPALIAGNGDSSTGPCILAEFQRHRTESKHRKFTRAGCEWKRDRQFGNRGHQPGHQFEIQIQHKGD